MDYWAEHEQWRELVRRRMAKRYRVPRVVVEEITLPNGGFLSRQWGIAWSSSEAERIEIGRRLGSTGRSFPLSTEGLFPENARTQESKSFQK